MRENFRNQRHQALEFLAQSGVNGDRLYLPYTKERNGMGKLPTMNSESKLIEETISIPRHRQKVSLIVPPTSQKVVLIKKNLIHFFARGEVKNTSINTQSKIHDTSQLTSILYQDRTVRQRTKQADFSEETSQLEGGSQKANMLRQNARRYKQFMKLKAYTELNQNYESISPNQISPETRGYRWKMNQVEKMQFLELIKSKKRIGRDTKQIYKQIPIELPGIGHYQPNWDQVHPKSTFNILISKAKHQEMIEAQTIAVTPFDRKTPQQSISTSQSQQIEIKQQNEIIQMYNNLQNQVRREVQNSIKQSPQVRHPYENMTMKPLHPEFVDKFQNELKVQMKISQKLQQKIKSRLKENETKLEV